MPKKPRKQKHIPQRTCVGCREVQSKRTLIRIVRTPDGVFIDPSGKMAGRGAYLHDRRDCWQRGLESTLTGALKTALTDEDEERLLEYMNNLSPDLPSQ